MLIPSIDIQNGRAVQLRQGRELLIEGGDPLALLDRFAPLGEVAVIDLDAAMGTGDNGELIRRMVRRGRCRVGGGIRDRETALDWLDAGAARIILGTAATPELLADLPRDRIIAAVDAWEDEVVVEGWRSTTGDSVEDRIERLRPHVGGFLATFVQNEGTGSGLDLERARTLRRLVGEAELVVAGGTRSAMEVARLDAVGIDVQVGRALYDGTLDETEILAAMLTTDRPDGLWPTVVCSPSGEALGLTYSSERSLRRTIETGRVFYESRRRGLWEKGATSGARQTLRAIDLDCDRDAIRFTVDQEAPGFCHEDRWTCWDEGRGVEVLERRLRRLAEDIGRDGEDPSYTRRLLRDPGLLASKLQEEARELAASDADVVHEAADLTYFIMARLVQSGIDWSEVVEELDRRALRIRRRGGDAKTSAVGEEVVS